ncbi:unnamed protein product [Didymodactylos carnosus]|uniref:G-protein coupled receptors family 1 profile domain-containing protein n=1 Tax=Didymodactylos carnosus TaxID=1234261 RepID=A0A814H7F4_9BILA|nr:unnamed protein product [Didymodactylos carnosus]CAF3777488.1 unnamed protein product [Didymodactylos carnosus]
MNTTGITNLGCPPEWDLLSNTFSQALYIYLTPIIIGIGLCGNILTILVFSRTDLQRQCVCVLTITLAVADSFVLVIPVLMIWLETILKREFSETSIFWCRTHATVNSAIIYRLSLRGIVDITSNITLMLILVCIMHLVCTIPFQSCWLYYQVVQEQENNCEWLKSRAKWRNFTFTIRNINYMLNFFLYSCSSLLFRDELFKLIYLCLFPSTQPNYPAYYYRRNSGYDNTGRRFSLSTLILRRLSRTTEYTNG